MLTKTSETAIKALTYMSFLENRTEPVSPKKIANHIGASPTYLAKITGLLVKANILQAHMGMKGGVTFTRDTRDISFLDIVEACQGKIQGNYCQECDDPEMVCAYHKAMLELHHSITKILERWTLADIVKNPGPHMSVKGTFPCRFDSVDFKDDNSE